jgi:hypothetical protein
VIFSWMSLRPSRSICFQSMGQSVWAILSSDFSLNPCLGNNKTRFYTLLNSILIIFKIFWIEKDCFFYSSIVRVCHWNDGTTRTWANQLSD